MKTFAEISHNAKAKIYPDGSVKLIVASAPIFKDAGWEACSNADERLHGPSNPELNADEPEGRDRERGDSVRRSRQKVFDLAALNEWDYFVTLTLDRQRIDRYDPDGLARRTKKWLDNGVQRHGWRYLLVPEHHKDGAIHMHGLFSGSLRLVDSGKKDKGRTIYNLPQWRYGFTTAIRTYGGAQGVSRYILKYIVKDFDMIFGNRYYAGGRGLIRQPPCLLLDCNFHAVPGTSHIVKNAGLAFKYIDLQMEDGRLPEILLDWT